MDLIKTIEENADVENYSEDSDAEVEVRMLINGPLQELTKHEFSVSTDKSASKEERRVQQ